MGGDAWEDPAKNPALVVSELEDAAKAIADLCHRSGARQLEIGWLYDEDDVEYATRGACWWAKAQYRGARIIAEDHDNPASAADHLAAQILDGGRCQFCQHATQAAATALGELVPARGGPCLWRRDGDTWVAGCGAQPSSSHGMNRARRRAAEKKERRRR